MVTSQQEKSYCLLEHAKTSSVAVDLTACDVSLWGCMKDKEFAPPLPLNLQQSDNRHVGLNNTGYARKNVAGIGLLHRHLPFCR